MTIADAHSPARRRRRRVARENPRGPGPDTPLEMFNRASPTILMPQLTSLSGSYAWARAMLAARPFSTTDAALAASDTTLAGLPRSEVALAIASHPPLGRAPQRGSASEAEQAALLGTLHDDDGGATELERLSRAYESRFGHVFLLCARGLGRDAVLASLRSRIGNDAATEWAETVEQLRLINRARLADLIGDDREETA